MIINSDGADGGFHAYWLLNEPHYITDKQDQQRCQDISTRWLEELREHAKPGSIDGTANIDRILRPVGSVRKSGNSVVPQFINDNRRYSLDQFLLPEIERPEAPKYNSESRYHDDSESVIEKYLSAVGLNSVAAILSHRGYRNVHDGFWIRPGSQSGAPTGEIFTKDNREGFTVKSGAADPLSCTNGKGGTGNWYSTEALFVSFENNCDASNARNPQAWKDTAKFCHEYFDRQKPKVDLADFMADDEPETKKEEPKQDPDKNTKSAEELLASYLDRLRNKTVPQLYKLGPALDGIEVGPELLCCIGAPPSVGKTALAMQVVYEVLEYSPNTRVVIANAETSPNGLFARQLSAVTRIDSSKIRFADLTDDELEQVAEAIGKMSQHMQTVEFMLDPGLEGVIDLLNSKPGLLVCDYLQKFSPGDKDPRIGVNLVVGWLRKLCLKGWAVLALSATKRDSKGKHSADELGMSSFRESGDIEFNLDSAYVLKNNGPIDDQIWLRHITLKCEKNRNGAKQDFELRFHMPQMSFDCYDPVNLDEFNAWSGSAFAGCVVGGADCH